MRILHINGNYMYSNLHQKMVEGIERYGIRNEVAIPTYDQRLSTVELNDNARTLECFRRSDRFFFHTKQKKIIRAIQENYSVDEYDVIHAYTLFTDGNAALELSRRYKKPFVVAVRNTDVNTFFRYMPHLRHVGIDVMREAERIFFLSSSYREHVIGNYVARRDQKNIQRKSDVIPNGIDEFWLNHLFRDRDYEATRKRIESKILRLVYAGGIDKNKNIGLTSRAMKLLRAKGWDITLTVVGAIVEQPAFEEIRNEPGILFIPQLPKEQLIEQYRKADVFVMPSHHESFGLVYAEAMSQGLPVLYTRGQGFDGQFEEGVVGYSVDSGDPEELSGQIVSVTRDYEQRSGRCLHAASRFDWEEISKVYVQLYREIADRSRTECKTDGKRVTK